jgi:hypothetical protein
MKVTAVVSTKGGPGSTVTTAELAMGRTPPMLVAAIGRFLPFVAGSKGQESASAERYIIAL